MACKKIEDLEMKQLTDVVLFHAFYSFHHAVSDNLTNV